ncbi:beta-glucosidase [Nakamurella silvestris]|nr:beta-glucosidase [Nakamurella silvestris]
MTGLPTPFPPTGFLWGITSAATSIEARPPRPHALSIWDIFAGAPGRIADGTFPTDGPDHLEYWRSDVELLADLGVGTYRFSLPWSLLAHDRHEIDFYDGLVDALLERGISPVVTLTHYDMPLSIMEAGGWLARDTAEVFADFATAVGSRLADRVAGWVTLNSPLVHTVYGYGAGIEAPGLTLLGHSLQAGMYQLLGHGLAMQALRAVGATSVGLANNHTQVRPASDSEADIAAAGVYDALHNHAFSDPLFLGRHPSALQALVGAAEATLTEEDLAHVRMPMDFYGVNYFHPVTIAAATENSQVPFTFAEGVVSDGSGGPEHPADTSEVTDNGWPIDATALTRTLTDLKARYPDLPPVLVTETGIACAPDHADPLRGRFLTDHAAATLAARDLGVDVRGLYYWTLLDGWEFGEGLTRSYGLVAVDPETGERTKRESFVRCRDLIAQGDTAARPVPPKNVTPLPRTAPQRVTGQGPEQAQDND